MNQRQPEIAPIRLYEELEGGSGRSIFFRPQRYRVSELKPLKGILLIAGEEGGSSRSVELVDLSQGGAGFYWDAPAPSLGAELYVESLRFDEHESYRGSARVVSLREESEQQLIGIEFGDSLIDTDELLQLRDFELRAAGAAGVFGGSDLSWQVSGHQSFKAEISELRLFLEDWEEQLNRLEGELTWGGELAPVQGVGAEEISPGGAAEHALKRLISEGFTPQFLARSERLQLLRTSLSNDEEKRLQRFSQRHLDPLMMRAPWMHRARTKPLGYPGDFQVMNHIYRGSFEGRDFLARALNYASLQSPAAASVRARKKLMKRALNRRLDQALEGGECLSLLSVAAGPAEELFELLQERTSLPPIELVLFEQDPAALSFAYRRIRQLVEERWSEEVQVIYLHDSIRRLLDDKQLFSRFNAFDVILCSGLYDYLRHSTAVRLSRYLYSRLAPSGELLIGNMVPNNPSRWIMEHHLDWHLLYRSHDEMCAFAHEAAPDSRVEIIPEETGVNPFVSISRIDR